MKYNSNNLHYEMLRSESLESPITEEDEVFYRKHNLLLVIYSKLAKIDENNKILLMMNKFQFNKAIRDLCEIANAFECENIDYRVLKGISIANTYPNPFTRVMGDHDICVNASDFERAKEVLKSLGYTNPNNVFTYKDVSLFRPNSLTIELHHLILNKEKEFFADDLMALLWDDFSTIELGETSVKVPIPETHFRYILVHMMKHLKGGGIGIRHLLDVIYFSKAYEIDLADQSVYFRNIGYGEFYKAIVSICVHYLDMPLKDQSWLFDKDDKLIEILSAFIAESGIFGMQSERLRISHFYKKYIGTNKVKLGLKSIRNIFFPKSKLLTSEYSYAIRNPYLLPVAWCHRLFKLTFSKSFSLKEKVFFLTVDDQNVLDTEYILTELNLKPR